MSRRPTSDPRATVSADGSRSSAPVDPPGRSSAGSGDASQASSAQPDPVRARVELLARIEQRGTPATRDERRLLARYDRLTPPQSAGTEVPESLARALEITDQLEAALATPPPAPVIPWRTHT